jgi:hypothetical protein
VTIGQEPFDSRLLADLRAGTDVDDLVAQVVDHYRMTKRQARDFLSFMTFGTDALDERSEASRPPARVTAL